MNKIEANDYAESVTLQDVKEMFVNAQNKITDWKQVSVLNKGMSKGVCFNILTACLDKYKTIDDIRGLVLKNMLREFGEFLPGYIKPIKKQKTDYPVAHQEPKFI